MILSTRPVQQSSDSKNSSNAFRLLSSSRSAVKSGMNRTRISYHGQAVEAPRSGKMMKGTSSSTSGISKPAPPRRLSASAVLQQLMRRTAPVAEEEEDSAMRSCPFPLAVAEEALEEETASEDEQRQHDNTLPFVKAAGKKLHDNMLPIVKVTRPRRFSFMEDSSSRSSHLGKKSLRRQGSGDDNSKPLLTDASSTTAYTKDTMSLSSQTNAIHQQSTASDTHSTTNNDTPTGKLPMSRRRSSRKSVNGLVIEFDLDDESECTMFANCEDYEDDWRPSLSRQASNESLEELRTRLEALEHSKQQQQLPEHDEIGLGDDCMVKKYMEALESSSRRRLLDSSESLREIPEDEDLDGDDDDDGSNRNGSDDEGTSADGEDSQTQTHSRRSTIRSSINGLVLEYDWSSSDNEEEEEEDEQNDDAHKIEDS